MPRIRRIQIKNFRSIHSLDIETQDLSVFVGDNDSGKSNILRALNLFFNGKTNPGQDFDFRNDYNLYTIPIANKAEQIEITLDLELPSNYHHNNGQYIRWKKTWRANGLHKNDFNGFNLVPKRRGTGFKNEPVDIPARSHVRVLLPKIEFEYVPAIRSAAFFRTLRGRIYKVISEVAEQGMRETSGDFENAIAGYVTSLIEDISGQLGDDAQISMPNDLSNIFEQLDFLYSDKKISLDNRGDGIKARYIPLILKFIAAQKRALGVRGSPPHTFIWAYEEPENNLEFRRAQELADTFCDLARDDLTQILLTTHSPIFYNLANDNSDSKCAVQVTWPDGARGTQADVVNNDSLELDQVMGVMSIIAPHIAQAQNEVDALMIQTQDLQEQMQTLNPDNRPTIFVEGPTEYRLFSELLNRFGNGHQNQIFLAQPPTRAGANYVTNMLRSWEYRVKHQQGDRPKAVGIIDKDDEGNQAVARFTKDLSRTRYTACLQLSLPQHLARAADQGLDAIICLEQLWPAEIWRHASEQNWVTASSPTNQLTKELAYYMLDNGQTIADIFTEEEQMYLKHLPAPDHKINWVEHMVGMNDEDLHRCSLAHRDLLAEALSKLGFTTMPGIRLI